jgi:hypothetical protein
MSLQQIQWKTSRKARETGDGDWGDTHILRAARSFHSKPEDERAN